ncbi:MAG: hypothetical protein F9K48_01225 [Candidatus Brocadia sp.]|nr:MAG: hypothetical protein F9K48_01225 [Candidatus Brocadia sp.]
MFWKIYTPLYPLFLEGKNRFKIPIHELSVLALLRQGGTDKKLSIHELNLRFFDLNAIIKSDSYDFINLFAQMYHRFRGDGSSLATQPPVEFFLKANPDNHQGKPIMILDGEVRSLSDPGLLEGYAYESILIGMITRMRSHLLIHAGVVSRNGQGVILAADARHGKTTLVLELVRRGFRFLSDEMAALGRADRKVHPFPRSLRVRRGTLELTGFSEVAAGAPTWLGKYLLDIEEIKPGSLGEAVPVSHIIILQDPAEIRGMTQDNSGQEVCVLVDRQDEFFLDAVRQNEDVRDLRVDADGNLPTLRFRAIRANFVLSQIETLCREHQILVLDVTKGEKDHPTFKTPAALKSIPRSQASMELLNGFQGGYMSELVRTEFGGSSARLFMELSAIVGQANCYHLSVGPLHEMADLVCSAVGA